MDSIVLWVFGKQFVLLQPACLVFAIIIRVAVGMPLTRHPPHRSQRALL